MILIASKGKGQANGDSTNAAFNLKQAADAIKAGQGDANGMVKTGAIGGFGGA